jgi:hypothetical protein
VFSTPNSSGGNWMQAVSSIESLNYLDVPRGVADHLRAAFSDEFNRAAPAHGVPTDGATLTSVRTARDERGQAYLELAVDGGTTWLVWDGSDSHAEREVRALGKRTAETFF